MKPEERARIEIDELLDAVGWHVCDVSQANLHDALGVALHEAICVPQQKRSQQSSPC